MPAPLHLADLRALSRRPMTYSDPERAASLGLPPFVRAASSVALVSDQLLVVQDDVHALARVDPRTARAEPLPLPLGGPLARSRDDKADLEACALLPDGRLLVLGSGARPERRCALAVSLDGDVAALQAAPLYDAVDRALAPMGGATNVEGVTLLGDALFLLQRAPGRGGAPCVVLRGATSEVLASLASGAPVSLDARAVDLGDVDGTRITWTDGVALYGVGLAFTATAEDTSDPTQDGAVAGSFLGLLDRAGRVSLARLLDVDGAPLRAKIEGLALAGARAWLVVDPDDEATASDLIEVPFGVLRPLA